MQQLLSIQALRALAAVMVVFAHAQNDAGRTAADLGAAFQRVYPLPWAAGVDLFFVVSGFVMVFSSDRMFAAPGGATQFLGRRIARIVPLYWLATSIFLVAAIRGAAAGKVLAPTTGEIVSSFAFFPWPRSVDGLPRPIHSLGWTLEYEMFFYLVFAGFLWFPRFRAVAGVAAFLGAIVAAGFWLAPQNIALAYWSDPIMLEFALGMGLALLYRRGLRLPPAGSVALLAAAVAILVIDPMHSSAEPIDAADPSGFLRLFSWGLPMAAVFAVATFGIARTPENAAMRMLTAVGDASYALYLFHPLAVILLRKAWLAAGLGATLGFWPLVALETLAAIALALAIHTWIERPLTKGAQAWLVRRPAASAAPAAARV